MSYAIISVGGKQYRVREGERLLVDRVAAAEGETFTPPVLLVGGDGETAVAPSNVTVTVKVLGEKRGPKIRIGKYRQRTGYKRHTGFRAALSEIEVESIGGARKRAAKPAAEPRSRAEPTPAAEHNSTAESPPVSAPSGLPDGYAEMTVAQVKEASDGWDESALAAALEFERANANRKGAIAALESAQEKEG
jgi:large subunit ribosomal protein L21